MPNDPKAQNSVLQTLQHMLCLNQQGSGLANQQDVNTPTSATNKARKNAMQPIQKSASAFSLHRQGFDAFDAAESRPQRPKMAEE